MGDKMNNMGKMLNNPKQRNIYLLGIGAASLTLLGGLWYASRPSGTSVQAGASVAAVPRVDAVPGSSTSQRYNERVNEKNQQEAQKALENNKSFVPTPVNNNAFSTESPIDALDRQQQAQREKEAREKAEKEAAEAAKIPPPPPPVHAPAPVAHAPAPVPAAAPAKPKGKYSEEDYVLISTLTGMWKNKATVAEYDFAGDKQGAQGQQPYGAPGQQYAGNGYHESNAVNQPAQPVKVTPMAKAGTIFNAVLETAINSDEPGPVLAKIVSGELKGTRLIGKIRSSNEKVLVEFNTASLPDHANSIRLQAVAIDPSNSRTGLATDVDRHYFLRYGVLLASAFLGGYADAIARQNTTTIVTPEGRVVSTSGELSSKDINRQAVGSVGKELASQTRSTVQGLRPTVTVDGGTAIGILLMEDLVAKQ